MREILVPIDATTKRVSKESEKTVMKKRDASEARQTERVIIKRIFESMYISCTRRVGVFLFLIEALLIQ